MPYSPIHDDDICAQLEPLLDAASVPATIVNWGGDEPVSVQEWSAYFGELLGVEAEVVVEPRSRARRCGSVGDHTKRISITGPCRVGWRDGFRRMAEHFYPDRVVGRLRAMARYPRPPTQLLAEARGRAAGSSDFGPGDFRDGLGVLLDSLERDGDLEPGELTSGVVGDLRRRLVNRLEVEAWYARAPRDRGRSPCVGPSTSTACPAPAPPRSPTCCRSTRSSAACAAGSRRSRARRRRSTTRRPTPAACSCHARTKRAPGRAQGHAPLRRRRHHGGHRAARHGLPRPAVSRCPVYGYHAWWRGADADRDLQYHRRVVKLLQSQRPPDLWLFKAPHHNFHLEAIVSAYPDTRFVMTHRDPAQGRCRRGRASCRRSCPPADGERDLHRLGREVSNHLRVGVEHAIAARARIGEDRFLDVHHRDLIADPMGTVRRVYDFLGLELTPVGRAGDRRLAGGEPLGCPRNPPLHRRAVRPEHAHSSAPTTTSTSATSTSATGGLNRR